MQNTGSLKPPGSEKPDLRSHSPPAIHKSASAKHLSVTTVSPMPKSMKKRREERWFQLEEALNSIDPGWGQRLNSKDGLSSIAPRPPKAGLGLLKQNEFLW